MTKSLSAPISIDFSKCQTTEPARKLAQLLTFDLPYRYPAPARWATCALGNLMNPLRRLGPISYLPLFIALFAGCGGGGSGTITPPPTLAFTSTPSTAAAEGVQYSYQVTATSSDASAVTFSLAAAPSGAAISGNVLTWTPTHAEARTPNAFTLQAMTANGASKTQSWGVTPNGTVNITAVVTYWTPSGQINVPPQWLSNLPYPAALIPQSDGSLQRLQGAANADSSFSIPNVPAGFYWLQIGPNANYWTSTSDFDNGRDVIGRPLSSAAQTTTTFDFSLSGLQPGSPLGDVLSSRTDVIGLTLPLFGTVQAGSTTFQGIIAEGSNIDWTKVTTIYIGQYIHTNTGAFSGYLLGPSQTLSNVAFVPGASNPVDATLSAAPPTSLHLQIAGSAWATLASSIGPGSPAPSFSDYSAFVQPYVSDRLAITTPQFPLGPGLTLIRPAPASPSPFPIPSSFACGLSSGVFATQIPSAGVPPILTDTDAGTLSYSDPYSADWPRMFEYCQVSTVSLPRPNSSVTDIFFVTHKQITDLPQGPVTPILGSVQSPTLNGASLFQSATLNSTNVTVAWNPPAIGQPYGYIVEVFQIAALPNGATAFLPARTYSTRSTSLPVPFLSVNNTYVFTILAASDANANIETSPFRHKLPFAESGVVSAPFVIQ